ncbi:MAG: GAF domain-containing protein [Chloroflexi bacterium]|nr:GAF domain-containing protein [Chloroflexota bacterium]
MSVLEGTVIPENDAERLAAIRRYGILDTPSDGAFDRITALAARVFNVPIAIVSVVDHDRIWFKSHHGLEISQIDRAPGLCASAILQDEPWIISDAPHDLRALANPLVAGEFGLKFYAGVPLALAGGHNMGTLCILDFEPRELSADETSSLQDLADMVTSELELRLASREALDAATERERVKDAFVGMLSHEIRTPVTTIYAAARVLASSDAVQSDARARDLFPDIVSESERLLRLIEDLLVLTKVEQGVLESESEPVLLQRVVERAVARARRRHRARAVEVTMPPDLPPVAGDEVFVEQVVNNLLSNALKYSPDDATVSVDAAVSGDLVEVRVGDRGIGLAAADRERVFDLLTRTREAENYAAGAGIGLYVCRRLLQTMGGDIYATAQARGNGAVFSFTLPIAVE